MLETLQGLTSCVARPSITALLVVITVAPHAGALPNDKAMYVGGTVRGFPKEGLESRAVLDLAGNAHVRKVVGRFDTRPASELSFDAGGMGTLAIQYSTITAVTYGLTIPNVRSRRGGAYLMTWDPLDQFTDRAHYFMSIAYRGPGDTEEQAVFELGRDIVRPTLGVLEARTGKAIEITDISACLLFKVCR